MRVLICPDSFGGTLTAVEAATALADGWLRAAPGDDVQVTPLSDGGPGFVDVLHTTLGGRLLPVPTTGPLGGRVTGSVLLAGTPASARSELASPAVASEDVVAYVESAQACGLHLVDRTDPTTTTSYGLGPLLTAAIESGVRRIVVGLGGSATNDAGAGMLAALGAAPLDSAGYALPYGGAALLHCAGLGGVPRTRGVELVAATDVDNPLTGPTGASTVYGPQKGATPADVLLLDAALARFATVLEQGLSTCPAGLAALPGSGAAGGLGAAILALGGRCESGIALVLATVDLAGVDLVLTGEGSFDAQSLRGKVVAGVAEAARDRGVPCVVVAGRTSVTAAEARVAEVHSLVDHLGGVAAAMAEPARGLRELGERLASRLS